MKKWVFVGLSVVPLVLAGAASWVRHAAWDHMEEAYRKELLTRAIRYSGQPGLGIVLSRVKGGQEYLNPVGAWSRQELKAIVPEIHLIRRPPSQGSVADVTRLQFFGPPYVLMVSLDHDRGEFIEAGNRSSDELAAYALSPETCRAIKRHVWQRYGAKLRALKVSPPP